MDQQRFEQIVSGFDRVRIAVVGDICLDRIFYVDRSLDEVSLETGLAAYQVWRRKSVPGAAGVVTNNLHSLRVGKAYGVALAGDDGEGYDLLKGLGQTKVDTTYMVRNEALFTPAYTKTFFEYPDRMEETHRIDIKNRQPTPPQVEDEIIRNLIELEGKVDAFVALEQMEDGGAGVFTRRVLDTIAEIGKRGKAKVFADSRYHIADFRNTVVKCNDIELLRSAGLEAEEGLEKEAYFALVEEGMRKIGAGTGLPMFVSCGEAGIKVLDGGRVATVPAFRLEGTVDICGAGDSAMTGIACAVCAGADLEEAALIGNLVASIIVQQIGVTGIASREQLQERFTEYSERWQ